MNTSKPGSNISSVVAKFNKAPVTDVSIGELMKAVELTPSFPSNKNERKALVEAHGKVIGFEPQDAGDSNDQNGAVVKLLGAALGASRATVDGFE